MTHMHVFTSSPRFGESDGVNIEGAVALQAFTQGVGADDDANMVQDVASGVVCVFHQVLVVLDLDVFHDALVDLHDGQEHVLMACTLLGMFFR